MKNGALLSLLLHASIILSQSDGITYKLTYSIDVESEYEQIQERLAENNPFGEQAIMIFDEGNYYQAYGQDPKVETFYSFLDNRQYQRYGAGDTTYFIDCSIDNRITKKFESQGERLILDRNCECYLVEREGLTMEFCFTDEFKLDIEKFSDHKFSDFNTIMNKCKGPYLYFSLKYPTYTMKWTATDIRTVNTDLSEKMWPIRILKEMKL